MRQTEARELIKKHLETGKIAEIYRNTYYSLLDRVAENGCYPESVGEGGYGAVMFCRTTVLSMHFYEKPENMKPVKRLFGLHWIRRVGWG